jgi:Domain of unknown function (DUF4251)
MNISKLISRWGLFMAGVVMVLTAARCSNEVYAQNNSESEALISRAVETQNYIFKAQQAMPTSGRTRQLNTDYDLRVSKDSVASWLPYFGRAYQAPLDPTKGGFQFTSTDFEYSTNQRNDGWEITIKPKDTRDVQELFLTVFKNGSANLRVSSISRQPISFGGVVVSKS